MKLLLKILALLTFMISLSAETQGTNRPLPVLSWSQLPDLPPAPGKETQPGVAGAFVGVSNGALLVAGGANFPEKPVWEKGVKVYYDDIFVLERTPDDSLRWHTGFKLPRPLAYGVSITTEDGVVCIGGEDNRRSYANVFLMTWNPRTKQVEFESLPALPQPVSSMAGAKINNTIYIAGGRENGQASNRFRGLQLSKRKDDEFAWQDQPDFPGPPRIQPVAASQNAGEEHRFYLFSGWSYPEEQPEPYISTNGYSYNPVTGVWTKLADIVIGEQEPISVCAGVAFTAGAHHILVVGGTNKSIFTQGLKLFRNRKEAKKAGNLIEFRKYEQQIYDYLTREDFGLNKNILAYHTITDTWTSVGEYPFNPPVTTTSVAWNDGVVIPSGEIRAGVRTPKIYFSRFVANARFGWLNSTVLIGYLLGMLSLGYYFMNREKSTEDFFKAGGRIPWWAAGLSVFATMLSAITFMAIPAKSYAADWRYFTLTMTILLIAPVIVYLYLPFFRRLNLTSAYEYLEVRFNLTARLFASSLFSIFMLTRIGIVLFLPSLALSIVTGIEVSTCILLMGLVTIIYCVLGGIEAVVWADVIQGFILIGGALLAAVYLIVGTEGGLSAVINLSQQQDKLRIFDFAFDFTQATFWVVLFGGLAINLISYSSDQAIIQRYLTTKDEPAARRSIWLNGIISISVAAIFFFIGTAMFAFYKTHPQALNPTMANPDAIFPFFIMSELPAGISGILIAAVFSAAMSTLSSNINSVATAFTTDFYRRFKPGAGEQNYLKVARISSFLVGALGIGLALLMATWEIKSLFDQFNIFLGLFASGLGGLFAMGIFTKRIHGAGALIGLLSSAIVLAGVKWLTPVSFLLYGFIGLVACVIAGYFSSLLIPRLKKSTKGLTIYSLKPIMTK